MEGANGNSGMMMMSKKIKIEAHFSDDDHQEAESRERKIELNLGLSMNGRFGVDPSTAKNKLKRSSSLTNLPAIAAARAEHSREVARGGDAPLPRASSLPSETDEAWGRFRRPGKEVVAAEARKKRMEKMKGVRVVKTESGGSGLHEGRRGGVDLNFPDNANGSVGSQMGSTGSLVPQLPAMIMIGGSSSRQIPTSNGIPRPAGNRQDRQRLLENAMLNMPHVATKADGEGASRIEGILYKYARADELKIVCACHGHFFTPAEFVKHGGGGDVAQPLRHILVNPCPLFQS